MKDHLFLEDFYNIKLFDSIKNESTNREIKKAYELVKDEVFEKKDEINDLENKLLNLSKTCQDGTLPLLSLRCRVSNLLFKSINYKFQKIDLYSRLTCFLPSLSQFFFLKKCCIIYRFCDRQFNQRFLAFWIQILKISKCLFR